VPLVVYDVIGCPVSTLARGCYATGRHNIVFRQDGLASGIYVHCLEAAGTESSGKLIVAQQGKRGTSRYRSSVIFRDCL